MFALNATKNPGSQFVRSRCARVLPGQINRPCLDVATWTKPTHRLILTWPAVPPTKSSFFYFLVTLSTSFFSISSIQSHGSTIPNKW